MRQSPMRLCVGSPLVAAAAAAAASSLRLSWPCAMAVLRPSPTADGIRQNLQERPDADGSSLCDPSSRNPPPALCSSESTWVGERHRAWRRRNCNRKSQIYRVSGNGKGRSMVRRRKEQGETRQEDAWLEDYLLMYIRVLEVDM
ncbi:hypothetical protein B0I35DRAFT_422098 [Stachybotrys elegans]|uniref:Secreted protein n=1 Tax=Stachybotrys elegans TaxID=80388 RepID=A0A8K0SVY6_9HYPO|nr:hypothetical protein B0I35DRAFT_422098 [Stachybotrys elegans]